METANEYQRRLDNFMPEFEVKYPTAFDVVKGKILIVSVDNNSVTLLF